MATQGSISPFAKVIFHLKSKSRVSVTPFDLAIAKSGPHASRVASVVIVVVAVVVDIAEIVIVVVIRRTKAPPNRRGHGGMIISNLTVTGLIVIILKLIILFIGIRIISGSEYLKFRQVKQIISGSIHIALNITASVCHLVGLFGHRLHHGPQVRRKRRHKAVRNRAGGGSTIPVQGRTLIARFPAAIIGV